MKQVSLFLLKKKINFYTLNETDSVAFCTYCSFNKHLTIISLPSEANHLYFLQKSEIAGKLMQISQGDIINKVL